MIGQGYDGAAVMFGIHNGVAALIKKVAPNAMYVHCNAHKLNLCLVDSCKIVPEAEDFFSLMGRLYCFLSSSAVHPIWLELQKECYPGEAPRELQKLSDTRWACRATSCINAKARLGAIVAVLKKI